jgi:hypothetical protein
MTIKVAIVGAGAYSSSDRNEQQTYYKSFQAFRALLQLSNASRKDSW